MKALQSTEEIAVGKLPSCWLLSVIATQSYMLSLQLPCATYFMSKTMYVGPTHCGNPSSRVITAHGITAPCAVVYHWCCFLQEGLSALHYAARSGAKKPCERMVNEGALVNMKTQVGH